MGAENVTKRDSRNAPADRAQATMRLETARWMAIHSPFAEDREAAQDEIAWMTEIIERSTDGR